MANNIVSGLFGVTPYDVSNQYVTQDANQAMQFAQLTPQQQGQYGMFLAGSGLGRVAGNLIGGGDPEMRQAQQMQQVKQWISQSGVDMNTPEGLLEAARYANSIGATEGAMFFGQQAMEKRKSVAEVSKTEQQTAREQQKFKLEDQLRAELSSLPPNATEEDVINVVRKYGSPDAILKALETKATKLAAEGNIGEAGSVGKAGAYRDVNGVVHGAGEMKAIHAEFSGAQKLMNELNNIKVEDVQNAYSPMGIDWTTKGDITKKLAGAGTVDAQAKIAVAKLQQVIDNLPPGSASDADMRTAMSSFPGYGDMKALANWINRTKERLQYNIDKLSSEFGFKPTTVSSGKLDIEGTSNRQIVKTGKDSKGRKVVQYSDGSVEYAD